MRACESENRRCWLFKARPSSEFGRGDTKCLILGPGGGGGKSLPHLVCVKPFPSEKGRVYGSDPAELGRERRPFPLLGTGARRMHKASSWSCDPHPELKGSDLENSPTSILSLKFQQMFAFRQPPAAGIPGLSSVPGAPELPGVGLLSARPVWSLRVPDGQGSVVLLGSRHSRSVPGCQLEGPADTSLRPLLTDQETEAQRADHTENQRQTWDSNHTFLTLS